MIEMQGKAIKTDTQQQIRETIDKIDALIERNKRLPELF